MVPRPPNSANTASASTVAIAFKPDHPCSTHIIDLSTQRLLYIVETTVERTASKQKTTLTRVRRAGGEEIVAMFEWRDMFQSDIVTLQGKEPMTASRWVKKSPIPFKGTVTFKDKEWKGFKWKGFAPGLSLELHSELNKHTLIGGFQKPRGAGADKEPAMLVLDADIAGSERSRDFVVVSFLYLEKVRRERDEDGFSAESWKSS